MDLEENDIKLNIVKEKLNSLKIKLWIAPYYVENNAVATELNMLAEQLHQQLPSFSVEDILSYLSTLQEKSLENLKEREEFKNTGLATLKIRPPAQYNKKPFSIKILLTSSGRNLRELISKEINAPVERIRVICKGKILNDESLDKQEVRHGMQIMVLIMTDKTNEVDVGLLNNQQVDSTIQDVSILTKRKNPNGESYLEITDQSGKTLKLPSSERKALLMAMTLHEKGRSAIKSENFELALLLLLESDKYFSQCDSKLLDEVDNYGLLSLDLAWSYLNLQNISQLTDAQIRLNRCRQVFKKCYGKNLERLIALKGSTGNEAALFVRFYLLQAIIYYHQGNVDEAKKLFDKVDKDLKELKVDDLKLGHLLELGYKPAESRIALRESKNDADLAVAIIERKIAEQIKNRELERIDMELSKKRRKLGKCEDGSWVEPQFHSTLCEMGYSADIARWALSKTSNRIADAVTLIQENCESMSPQYQAEREAIAQVQSLGCDYTTASETLKKFSGDVSKATEHVKKRSITEASTSKKKETEDAFSRVSEGIDDGSEDHLDLTLAKEEEFLRKYQQLLM